LSPCEAKSLTFFHRCVDGTGLVCLAAPRARAVWRQWWNAAGAGWLYRAAIVSAVTCVAIPELAAAARRHTPGGGEVPKGLWVAAAGLLFKLASTAIAARMERVDA